MDTTTIAIIATAVLTAIGLIVKSYKKVLKAIKETLDVVMCGVESLMDGNLSPEEIEQFKIQFEEAKAAWKIKSEPNG